MATIQPDWFPTVDPYECLGITKDHTQDQIKKAYHKLALKHHPDKTKDEQAQAKFPDIQNSYELLTDSERKKTYDMLIAFKKRNAEAAQATGKASGPYNIRTAVPTQPQPARPARASHEDYDDDNRPSSRKGTDYERVDRRERSTKLSTAERMRYAAKKDQEKSRAYERDTKQAYDNSSSDSDAKRKYESAHRKRSEEDERVEQRRRSRDTRKKGSKYDDDVYSGSMRVHIEEAVRYMEPGEKISHREGRPMPSRNNSTYEDNVRSSRRTDEVKRSSARAVDRKQEEARRYINARNRDPQIVEPAEERRPPMFKQSQSSPADIKFAGPIPRASTFQNVKEVSPPRSVRRSRTELEEKDRSGRHSGLRPSEHTREDSGYSSGGTPDMRYSKASSSQKPSSTYTSGPTTIPEHPEPRYEVRDPKSSRLTRSPEATERYPMPQPQVRAPTIRQYSYASHGAPTSSVPMRPTAVHSQTYTTVPTTDRHRERDDDMLYGEVRRESRRSATLDPRLDPRERTHFDSSKINVGKRYGSGDVNYSSKAPQVPKDVYDRIYEQARRDIESKTRGGYESANYKPGLSRSSTMPTVHA